MSTSKPAAERVGFMEPPQDTRFKPGQSGNPRGRPKGSQNFLSVLRKSLSEKVMVTENSHKKRISKLELVTKQLVNQAAKGDPTAGRLLFSLMRIMDDAQPAATDTGEPDEADRKVMALLTARVKNLGGGDAGSDAS